MNDTKGDRYVRLTGMGVGRGSCSTHCLGGVVYLPAPQPSPLRPVNGLGAVSFALGLLVTLGLVVYAGWMAIAAMTTVSATQYGVSDASAGVATTPPVVVAPPVTPTPSGATMAFDQLWTSGDGNTIVAGIPTVGMSAHEGRSVIRVAVTLTNTGQRPWDPASMTFIGTVDGAPAPEAPEGDWMYSVPIVGHTSVTLSKVFVGDPGQFNLTVSTPNGVARFSGQV